MSDRGSGEDTGGPNQRESGTPRNSLRLLTDKTFGPYFFGKVLANSAVWVHNIAAAIVVYTLTESAVMVGAVSIAQFAPQLLIAPWSGALADRGDRRRQLVVGRLIAAGGSLFLSLWLWLAPAAQSTPLVIIGAGGVAGIGFAIGGPAAQALLPSLVRPAELASAVALNSVPFTLARSAGPALGASLLAVSGPAAAFGVAGLGNLAFAAVLLLIPIRQVERASNRDGTIRGGFRYLKADPSIAVLLVGVAMVGVGSDPVMTLTPPIADRLGGGPELVGLMASAFGAGAAGIFPVLGWLRLRFGSPTLGATGLLLMSGGTAILAALPARSTSLIGFAVAGAGMTIALTSLTSLLQERVPDDLRGRVMAMWSICFMGSRPVAAALNGTLADLFAVEVALTVLALLLFAGAWLARPTRLRQRGQARTRGV